MKVGSKKMTEEAVVTEDIVEIVEERTLFAKIYDLGGDRRRMVASRSPIHYQDEDGKFQDIDMDIEDGRVCKCSYDMSIYGDKLGYHGKAPDGTDIEMELETEWKTPKIEGNVATYEDIQDGVDLVIEFMPYGIRMNRVLKGPDSCREAVFRMKNGKGVKGRVLAAGGDAEGRKAEIDVEELSSNSDGTEVRFKQVWTGRVAVMDETTRKKSWSDEVEYPVVID